MSKKDKTIRSNPHKLSRTLFELLILLCLTTICLIEYFWCGYEFGIRLDQYASTIFGSIVGVVGTMFGLTAASYAFVWGELKGERESNIRMKNILNKFQSQLFDLFFNILFLSTVIIIFNLVLLGIIQHITNSTLYYSDDAVINNENVVMSWFYNEEYAKISTCALVDVFLSVIDIILMGIMNYMVFSRQKSYQKIAYSSLNKLRNSYDLSIEKISKFKNTDSNLYDLNAELSKIHHLELLINRIIKNHESEGDAFRFLDDEDKFLGYIISIKLRSYNLDWDYLKKMNEKKFNDLKEQSLNTDEIFNRTSNKGDANSSGGLGKKELPAPADVKFVKVYSDLIEFRNSQLISPQKSVKGTMLKCTVKKRMLFYLMTHERFDGMDLTNVSLSGADLSYSNFSNCNFKGVKLKGTNCKGVDFSNSRIPGMYFSDGKNIKSENIHPGDVEISFTDDGEEEYNIYVGHQPTCLEKATFANADVSRVRLICGGETDTKLNYPFNNGDNPPVEDGAATFSLRETNFDRAKLFDSEFNNIDLSGSSIFNAQMFHSTMQLVKADNVNFAETVLTHSDIKNSGFVNANFYKAVISDCNISRSDFTFANLSNTNFSNSIISYCNFRNTICNNTSFKRITFSLEKNKKESDCISFEFATLRKADFSNANLYKTNFSSANVMRCNFTKSVVLDSKFSLTVLTSTIWNTAEVKVTIFEDSILRDCVFINAVFENCTFNNCDFSNSIVNCKFSGGKMDNVKFCNVVDLDPQLFSKIKLKNVDFSGSKVRKRDFPSDVEFDKCKFDRR